MSLKPSAFLETIIIFLLPYFTIGAADMNEARAEILETLASYATRTRAEMLQAAQIIALSMTTLDVLAEAKNAEMSQSLRNRYRGCANGLNRSTIQTEKSLNHRLAQELPPPAEQAAEPVNDLADPDVQGAVDHARTAIEAHRSKVAISSKPAGRSVQATSSNQQIWAGAMMDALKQMGVPLQTTAGE